jgi:glycosyltransferase involved in cell wall biosynthesis
MNSNIFIVVPAWNEEKRIGATIKDLLASGYENIVVVDDCSSDKTFEIAKRFPIYVLRHKVNRDQGATLQTGTEFALKKGAEVIVHFDGDGQFLAKEIEGAIQPVLKNEADVVLGSRFLKSNEQMPWLKKNVIHPVARLIDYLFTGVKLSDAHCGFRALNRNAAEKIKITQDKKAHATEVISLIKKHQLCFKEVPITVIYHDFGQGIGGGFRILKELLTRKIIK